MASEKLGSAGKILELVLSVVTDEANAIVGQPIDANGAYKLGRDQAVEAPMKRYDSAVVPARDDGTARIHAEYTIKKDFNYHPLQRLAVR